MLIPAATRSALLALARAVDGGDLDLSGSVEEFLLAVRGAVPSVIAASVTLWSLGRPVTVSAASPSSSTPASIGEEGSPRVTMSVDLPGREGQVGAVLSVSATDPGAFDQLVADLPALLDMDPRRVRLTAGARLGDQPLSDQLDDVSLVAQALGVLLDRGMVVEEGLAELTRRASATGSTIPAAALDLLDGLTREPGDGRSSLR